MKGLLPTLLGVLLVTLLATPTLGAGWLWDIGSGLGFVAFAGLLHLSASRGRGFDLRAHQSLGFAVLGVATAHAYWFLLSDAVVIEYVKPGAPVYMWMGIATFVSLTVTIFVSLPKYRPGLHGRAATFGLWHRVLALVTIVGAGYHIVASGFYLNTAYQIVLFLVLTLIVLWRGSQRTDRGNAVTRQTWRKYLAIGTLCVLVFASIRNL